MSKKSSSSQQAQGSYIAEATGGSTATVQVVLPPAPIQEQNRVRFLKRLRVLYEDLWKQSLQGAAQLTLGLTEKPDVVLHHTELLLRAPEQPQRPLPEGTTLLEVYDEAGQELLLLGEPGAGKSTLLLELARQLVGRAEQDPGHPFPVLLPLSSWAVKQAPLSEWLPAQLSLIYDVPRQLSRTWIQTDQILPLLDGLDEVPQQARVACIEAITAYRKEHLVPLVVCSRRAEYEQLALQERLVLHSAVLIEPLLPEQVDTYLATLGKPLVALRGALRKNAVLRGLVTTPLILQVLMLTYHGISVREFPHKEAQLREQIWADYVQCMVARKEDMKHCPLDQTIMRLSWLARQMRQHSQTIFNLEQLQLDWLPKGRRAIYRWSVGLLFGLGVGLLFVLLFVLLGSLLFGLLSGLVSGLGVGLGVGLGTKIEPAEALTWSWKSLRSKLIVGLGAGLGVGLLGELLVGLLGVEYYSRLFIGLLGGLGAVLGVGLGTKIEPAEALTWSWKSLRSKLLFVLLFVLLGGLLFSLLGGQFGEPPFVLLSGLGVGLIGGLVSGLSRKQLTERLMLSPNEGIRRSLKYGLLAWLFSGLFSGLLFGLLFVLLFVLLRGLVSELVSWLGAGLLFGLLFGLVFGLGVGLLSGLGAVMQHYTLRFWLWQSHTFPWKTVPFLEDATKRILLRRVGGGYSFVHRLLLDYFADLNTGPAPASPTPPSAPGHSPSPPTPSA